MNIKFNFESESTALLVIDKELSFHAKKAAKEQTELNLLAEELRETKKHLREYKEAIRKILHITLHKVRQPMANILGLANLLHITEDSPKAIKQIVNYIKQSINILDTYTKELTEFITDIGKGKNKQK